MQLFAAHHLNCSIFPRLCLLLSFMCISIDALFQQLFFPDEDRSGCCRLFALISHHNIKKNKSRNTQVLNGGFQMFLFNLFLGYELVYKGESQKLCLVVVLL